MPCNELHREIKKTFACYQISRQKTNKSIKSVLNRKAYRTQDVILKAKLTTSWGDSRGKAQACQDALREVLAWESVKNITCWNPALLLRTAVGGAMGRQGA